MPRLRTYELCPELSPLGCRAAGCRNKAAISGDGNELPFCADDIRKLSRRTLNALHKVAGESVFDIDAVAKAAAIVASARLELRGKAKKK